MSQFSKKLALVCALGGLSLSLTGCHGSKGLPEFTVPEEFDTSRNYEITFWAKNDTNKTQTEIYKKAIADFEALYPNITVNLNLYTDYDKIYNDVITNIPPIRHPMSASPTRITLPPTSPGRIP